MAFKLHIEGEAKRIGLYRLNELGIEGVDFDPEMPLDDENIQEILTTANDYVESGELDILEETAVTTTLDPDATTIVLDADGEDEVEIGIDDITFLPQNVDKRLKFLQKARVGDLIFVRTETGEAYWDYSCEKEGAFVDEKVGIDYLDCTASHDEYEVLTESYLDFFCDRLMPDWVTYDGEKLEKEEHLMRTNQVWGELFIVKENLPDHRKVIEKVDLGGPLRLDIDESTLFDV